MRSMPITAGEEQSMPFYRKFPGFARILVLLMIGAILFGAMLFIVKRGQETVLLYLSDPGSNHEMIMKSSLSNSPEIFLSNFGFLMEMQPSPDGKWLALITSDDDGNRKVVVTSIRSRKLEREYACNDANCSALQWKPDASQLFFHISANGSTGSILSMQIDDGLVSELSLNTTYNPVYFSISADERYQVVYDENEKGFFILEDWNKELKLIKSEDASAVVWLDNPDRILLVTTEHDEKIPVSHIIEFAPETFELRTLKDSQISNMDFNNLVLHPNGEDLVFGCRPVQRTTSRQLCKSNLTSFIGQQLTNVQSRNHAGAVFDSSGTWLAYQTYDLESSLSVPTIWVMNWETGTTIPVEEKAAMPAWVP